jgi:hypothetical protein
MMDITGSTSEQNLRNAITGEHEAFIKFLRVKNIADVQGPPEVAELWRKTSLLRGGHPAIDQLFNQILIDKVKDTSGQGPSAVSYSVAGYIPGVMDYLWYPFQNIPCTQKDVDTYLTYAGTARAEGFEELAEWFTALADAERSQIPRTPSPTEPPKAQFGTFHFEPN